MNSHPTVASVWVTMSPGAFQKFAIFVVEILDGKRFICNVAHIKMIKSKWYQRSYIRVTYYIRVQHDPPPRILNILSYLPGNTAEYKPCAQFEGRFTEQLAKFNCNNGEGQLGQFVYIRSQNQL